MMKMWMRLVACMLAAMLLICGVCTAFAEQAAPAGNEQAQLPVEDAAAAEETAPEAPVAAPAQEVTAEKGSMTNPVLPGEVYAFEAQVDQDGYAATGEAAGQAYSVRFTLCLTDAFSPEDYQAKYASSYQLRGTEAGLALEATMESTDLESLILQKAVRIELCDVQGNVNSGYQLMDAQIAGSNDVLLSVGQTGVFYKRYDALEGEDMQLMRVTYYVNGAENTVYFQIGTMQTYETLTVGSRGDAVVALQQALIDMGYLDGTADGAYGAMTQAAVKLAQEHFGLEATGEADNALQRRLFAQ